MKLSVVIPVYNERKTLPKILSPVVDALPYVPKEIVIIDDCSVDGTRDWLLDNLAEVQGEFTALDVEEEDSLKLVPAKPEDSVRFSFRVLFHEQNQGKGGALRTGLTIVSGDVIVIQDADLEYDPLDWERMWPLIVERQVADVVYGSRFYGQPHRSLNFHHYLANRLISFLFNLLYNQTISDVEVCYKMFTREVLKSLALTANDFGIEIEFSAQVARVKHWRIYEVAISYFGRTYSEGKKITWKEGVKALWYLFKFRFWNSGSGQAPG